MINARPKAGRFAETGRRPGRGSVGFPIKIAILILLYTIVSASLTSNACYAQQFSLVVNTDPSGLDHPSGGGVYPEGSVATFAVSPSSGYDFVQWKIDGSTYPIYVISISGISGSWTTPTSMRDAVVSFAHQMGVVVNVIDSFSALDALIHDPPSRIIIINAHGEAMPMSTAWQSSSDYVANLGELVRTKAWVWVTVAGWPFYYTIGADNNLIRIGPLGINTFMSPLGIMGADVSMVAVSESLTELGSSAQSIFNSSFPAMLTISRAPAWRGVSPCFVFYQAPDLSNRYGVSTIPMQDGYFLYMDASSVSAELAGKMTFAFSTLFTRSMSSKIVMNSNHVATATFRKSQVSLTVRVPDSVTVAIDGINQTSGTVHLKLTQGQHKISVPETIETDKGTRLKFLGWTGQGEQTSVITVNVSDMGLDITGIFLTQYRLSIDSKLADAKGNGWYDEYSVAVFSLSATTEPISDVLGLLGGRWTFQGWYEDGKLLTMSASGSVVTDRPHTLVARWEPDYQMPLAFVLSTVSILLTVMGFWVYRNRTSRRPQSASSGERRYAEFLARLEEMKRKEKISDQTYEKLKKEWERKVKAET